MKTVWNNVRTLLWVLALLMCIALFGACKDEDPPANEGTPPANEQVENTDDDAKDDTPSDDTPSNTVTATDGLQYQLNADGNSYAVVGYEGTETDVVIPAAYENKPVTVIGEGAFDGSETLRAISLPACLEVIEDMAFVECYYLSSVQIADGSCLRTIGEGAFAGARLRSFVVPSTVTKIGVGAFESCLQLVQFTNLSQVQMTVMDLMMAIGNPNIGLEVRTSQNTPFVNQLITDSDGHVRFTVGDTVYWMGHDGELETIDLTGKGFDKVYAAAMLLNDTCKSVILPQGITSVGDEAFHGCTKLMNIALPDTLTELGSRAFYGCDSLYSVTIPASVTSVGSYLLNGCWKLVQITNLSGLEITGGRNPNKDEESRTSLDTPFANTLTVRDDGYVTYTVGETVYLMGYAGNSLDLNTAGIGVNQVYPYAFYRQDHLNSIVLAEGIKSIGTYAFVGCDFQSVTVPASLTILESMAFNTGGGTECFIENLYITDVAAWCAVQINGYDGYANPMVKAQNVYFGEQKAKDLVIPAGVTSIGSYCFADVVLESVTLPASIQTVGSGAFSNCRKIYVSDLVTWCNIEYADHNSSGFSYPYGTNYLLYVNNVLVEDLVIPPDVTKLNDLAFYGCGSLRSVTIPATVTEFSWGDSLCASFGCNYGLTEMTIASPIDSYYARLDFQSLPKLVRFTNLTGCSNVSVTSGTALGESEFLNIEVRTSLDTPFMNGVLSTDSDGVETYTVNGKVYLFNYRGVNPVLDLTGKGITNIYRYALYGSSVTSVILPEGVTHIGTNAFYDCYAMTDVSLPNSLIEIGDGCFEYPVWGRGATPVLNYNELNGLKYLGNASNPYLLLCSAHDVAPEKVTSLSPGGPYLPSNAPKNVVIPNGTRFIGEGAFTYNNVIEEVTIPASVTYIGASAFRVTEKLKRVNYSGTWDDWCKIKFEGREAVPTNLTGVELYIGGQNVVQNGKLIIPEGVTSINAYAFYGHSNILTLVLPSTLTSMSSSALPDALEVYNLSQCTFDGTVATYTDLSAASVLDIDANGYVFYEDGDDCYLVKYIGDSTVLTLPTDYNGKNYHIEEGAFSKNESIVSVTISQGVVCIHGEAFYGCYDLESVSFTVTEGWYTTSDEAATSGTAKDVSDASANAYNLRYSYSYWKRNV